MNFESCLSHCCSKADDLYNYVNQIISTDEKFGYIYIIEKFQFNFKIKFGCSYKGFDGISISVPPDCNRNKSRIIYETALIKNCKLVYIEEYGYEDIRRQISFQEVIDEIQRMVNIYYDK
jgi:hypothetical protein